MDGRGLIKREESEKTDQKTLMEKIDEFDDAVWVAGYGGNPKFSRETLKEMDAREKDEMLLSYWKLMSELLNEGDEK